MIAPDACHILAAERAAERSPCAKSLRGVVLFDPETGAHRGEGWNGPPRGTPCPGLSVCGDRCNKLCVHAEIRALRNWPRHTHGGGLHLMHVKLGEDGHVTPGGPPSCWQCSREILDVGFVDGVWLYEADTEIYQETTTGYIGERAIGRWRFYTAKDFHRTTLSNAGLA